MRVRSIPWPPYSPHLVPLDFVCEDISKTAVTPLNLDHQKIYAIKSELPKQQLLLKCCRAHGKKPRIEFTAWAYIELHTVPILNLQIHSFFISIHITFTYIYSNYFTYTVYIFVRTVVVSLPSDHRAARCLI